MKAVKIFIIFTILVVTSGGAFAFFVFNRDEGGGPGDAPHPTETPTSSVSQYVQTTTTVQYEQYNNEVGNPETYTVSTVFDLPYGKKEGQAGIYGYGAVDMLDVVPQAIFVTGGKIYLLDTANERVQIFSLNGKFEKAFPVGWAVDMAVREDGTIYAYASGLREITEYDPHGTVLSRRSVPGNHNYYQGLRIDASGDFAIRISETEDLVVSKSLRKAGTAKFPVGLDSRLLGRDRYGNRFLRMAERVSTSKGEHYKTSIHKITRTGVMVAEIPINTDYFSFPPERPLVIDQDGNIYHLRPLVGHTIVQVWKRNQ